MPDKAPIKFFACQASMHLAEKIAKSYGMELGKSSVIAISATENSNPVLKNLSEDALFL
jgi:hypothetical protein